MRLDKFLKVSRIIKRRTVANEACDGARVSVNGRTVKASYDVKVGDEITVMFGEKPLKIKVLNVKETVKKDEARDLYEIIG
ncbi:MAG: RNA-binding S4 domain-containing protein [Clostridiales bacterium]|nr:RNA-binding S4 domain-containing protein [Clostridiales bacterium]